MAHEELALKLKNQIIKYLNFTDLTPADIDTDVELFGPESPMELDSIDAIELSVLLEREYELKITDSKQGKKVMSSVASMADFIVANGKS